MIHFCSLYSGSSGNCLFLESGKTKVLIDAGTSIRKITDGLERIDKKIEDIDAILVTHEHSDHVQNLGSLSKKYNIPVYTNLETLLAMPSQKEKISEDNQNLIEIGQEFKIKNLSFNSFSIPHDAAKPCGFNVYDGKSKITIATDLGHMTDELLDNMKGSKFILLEANYDPEILKFSRYPFVLKQRISGPYGHLPNEESGKTISKLIKYDLEEVMLGHLSKENNFPELAYQTVIDTLHSNNVDTDSIKISVASRDKHSKIVKI